MEGERPPKLRKLSHELNKSDSIAHDHVSHLPLLPDTAQNAEVTAVRSVVDDFVTTSDNAADDESLQINEPDHDTAETTETLLSKNQRKKLKRQAEWEAGREYRKLKRKEKAKEKKARRKAERDDLTTQQDASNQHIPVQSQPRPRPRRHHMLPIAFIIDCGFDNLMVEKELISLGSQLTRAYSDNSRAPFQAHLYVSSWDEQSQLRKRFEGLLKGMYKNWKRIRFVEEDFVTASILARTAMKGKWGGKMLAAFEKHAIEQEKQEMQIEGETSKNSGSKVDELASSEQLDGQHQVASSQNIGHLDQNQPDDLQQSPKLPPDYQDLSDIGEVIYLTSDSPYTLTELQPYHTYVIGGLVDKNRHKGICYKTALNANSDSQTKELLKGKEIKTAKLPIGEYMSMTSRQVLATNHVIEIMLRWLEYGDWGRAFAEVMPKRKGATLKENIQTEALGYNYQGNGHEEESVLSTEDEAEAESDIDAKLDEFDQNGDELSEENWNNALGIQES